MQPNVRFAQKQHILPLKPMHLAFLSQRFVEIQDGVS